VILLPLKYLPSLLLYWERTHQVGIDPHLLPPNPYLYHPQHQVSLPGSWSFIFCCE